MPKRKVVTERRWAELSGSPYHGGLVLDRLSYRGESRKACAARLDFDPSCLLRVTLTYTVEAP